MPKATLTFSLPEDREEFEAACQAGAAKTLVWDIDQRCRAVLKHELEPSADRCQLAEEIREMIREHPGFTIW